MWNYLVHGLGWIIRVIYDVVQNYGLAIILFTVVVKLLLLPLNIHSQKSMLKQQRIQPYVAELQKKYANEPEKLQRETLKLYKDNDISMMGGCLPTLIQFPILIALYQVIRMPLSYLKNVDWAAADVIQKVIDLQAQMVEKFPQVIGNLANQSMENLANMYQIQLSEWSARLNPGDSWALNFNFLGLDLSQNPSSAFSYIMQGNFSPEALGAILLLLIPIVATLLTWLSSKTMQMRNKQEDKKADDNPAAQMSKSMTLMMPIMTLIFTVTLPAGLGIYWIVSSGFQIVQQLVMNYIFNKSDKEGDLIVKIPEKKNTHKRKKR